MKPATREQIRAALDAAHRVRDARAAKAHADRLAARNRREANKPTKEELFARQLDRKPSLRALARAYGIHYETLRHRLLKLEMPLKEALTRENLRCGTPQQITRDAEIVELYKSGLIYQTIGDRYRIGKERVRQILGKAGVEPPGSGPQRRRQIPKKKASVETGPRRREASIARQFGIDINPEREERRGAKPGLITLLARAHDILPVTLRKRLKTGMPLKKALTREHFTPGIPPQTARNAKIVTLYNKGGLSYRAIGCRFHIGKETVRQILNKAGVKLPGARDGSVKAARLARIAHRKAKKAARAKLLAKVVTKGKTKFTARHSAKDHAAMARRNTKWIALLKQGCTLQDIATKYGLTSNGVKDALQRMGQ